jgi:hypothetical protein
MISQFLGGHTSDFSITLNLAEIFFVVEISFMTFLLINRPL